MPVRLFNAVVPGGGNMALGKAVVAYFIALIRLSKPRKPSVIKLRIETNTSIL
jgi:hypothetical protein